MGEVGRLEVLELLEALGLRGRQSAGSCYRLHSLREPASLLGQLLCGSSFPELLLSREEQFEIQTNLEPESQVFHACTVHGRLQSALSSELALTVTELAEIVTGNSDQTGRNPR
jgi:hypothetical protein